MTEEIWQIHHPTPGDFEPIAQVEIEDPEPDWSHGLPQDVNTRQIILSRGGDEIKLQNDPYSWEESDDGLVGRTIIRDWVDALAYYLFSLETHGLDEEAATLALEERTDLSLYHDRQLTSRERRLKLMDLAEFRSDHSDHIARAYLNDHPCTWRSTNLSESASTLAQDIVNTVETIHPRLCYASAGESAIKHIDNHRVEYTEGLVLPQQACQVIRHAWLEIDGDVAEITWPWHFPDGSDAVYLGVTIPKSKVKESRSKGESNGPVIMDDVEDLRRDIQK